MPRLAVERLVPAFRTGFVLDTFVTDRFAFFALPSFFFEAIR